MRRSTQEASGIRDYLAADEPDVLRLFPTPFMRAKQSIESQLVADLVEQLVARATRNNASSTRLAHTALLKSSDSPLLSEVATQVAPKLVDFGVLRR